MGAIQAAMPKDKLAPEAGINIADIRKRALTGSDPDLHFRPKGEATTAYAQGGIAGLGGRIGLKGGSTPFQAWASSQGINLDTLSGNDFSAVLQHWNSLENKAQGGRIGYVDGELVEPDFREKAKDIGGSFWGMLPFGPKQQSGEDVVGSLWYKKYDEGLSKEDTIKYYEQ